MADIHNIEFSSNAVADQMSAVLEDLRLSKWGDVVTGACVFINRNGDLFVFGWGADGDPIRTVGLLSSGAAWLSINDVARR
jgi:hypothetical protein